MAIGKSFSNGALLIGGMVGTLPTATDDALDMNDVLLPKLKCPTVGPDILPRDHLAEKWGLGPTALALRQQGPWTYGGLVNHIWSFAGDDDCGDVNATFLQPFPSYTTPEASTYAVNTESTYNWESEKWSVPLNVTVSKVVNIGGQTISLGGGVRYWVDSPESGPEDFGFRLNVVFMFPP